LAVVSLSSVIVSVFAASPPAAAVSDWTTSHDSLGKSPSSSRVGAVSPPERSSTLSEMAVAVMPWPVLTPAAETEPENIVCRSIIIFAVPLLRLRSGKQRAYEITASVVRI
jgi:hypothetical protein